MADRRPVRYGDQLPASREPRRLPVPPTGPAPVHQPSSLSFDEPTGTREELWERLPASVRGRVEARVGRLVEWWAEAGGDGRTTAVVLGDQSLVTVHPTVSASGNPAYRVAALPLDPSSFRSVQVTGPTGEITTKPSQPAAPTTKGGPGGSQPSQRIPRDLASFLGYLPARAQTLLQEPFLSGSSEAGKELDWRYYYLRHGQEQGLSVATLQAWGYLTDLRTVTFTGGTGQGFRDGVGVDSWQLTCWRANRRR